MRRVSQLDLSLRSGVSPRHVSFLETGRSRPGRDVILRLADALEPPGNGERWEVVVHVRSGARASRARR